jgi:hypothetical protein
MGLIRIENKEKYARTETIADSGIEGRRQSYGAVQAESKVKE